MDPELDRRLTQKFTHVPSARGNQLFVFNIVSLVIIWISVFLRVYVRSRVLKSWGLDDYLMIAALVGAPVLGLLSPALTLDRTSALLLLDVRCNDSSCLLWLRKAHDVHPP